MIINIEQKAKTIRVSYVNTLRGISFLEIPLNDNDMFNWEYDNRRRNPEPNEPVSWDNKPIIKKANNMLSKYRIEEILFNLPQNQQDDLFRFVMPEKWFVDIETEFDNGWAKPELATNRVVMISGVNEKMEGFVMGLKKLTNQQVDDLANKARTMLKDDSLTFKYEYFEREEDMLIWFCTHWCPKMTMITGWNFLGYDWPYLYNRCRRLGLEKYFRSISPVNELVNDKYLPMHRMVSDYLDIYVKWDRVIDVKENNTLDYVANQATGFSKVKLPKGLKETYEEDFFTFTLYSLVDSVVLKLVDDKINTMQTFLSLANKSKVEYYRTFSPIYNTETLMNHEVLRRNQRLLRKGGFSVQQGESYEGAYVKTPVPGFYKYVACFDFASLYPTTQRQFNISPDTYLGKIQVSSNDKMKIITASGAVFDNSKDSIMRTIICDRFNDRLLAKNQMKKAEKILDRLKHLV